MNSRIKQQRRSFTSPLHSLHNSWHTNVQGKVPGPRSGVQPKPPCGLKNGYNANKPLWGLPPSGYVNIPASTMFAARLADVVQPLQVWHPKTDGLVTDITKGPGQYRTVLEWGERTSDDQLEAAVVTGVSIVSVPLQLPLGFELANKTMRVDISSKLYGMPRELCMSHDSVNTECAVYDVFTRGCPLLHEDPVKHQGKTSLITMCSDAACLVTPYHIPTDNVGWDKPKIVRLHADPIDAAVALPDSNTGHDNLYWCRLFQVPCFDISVDIIDVDIQITETDAMQLNCTHHINFNAPLHFSNGWKQALDHNYFGMFHHDVKMTVSII